MKKMMKYILERYRPDFGRWGERLEPEVNDGIHVDWWTYPSCNMTPKADVNERIKYYNPNGEAAIAAFVAFYYELVPKELYKDIIRYPVEHILNGRTKTAHGIWHGLSAQTRDSVKWKGYMRRITLCLF